MSYAGLEQVFTKWSSDSKFRESFRVDPEQATRNAGIQLSEGELETLRKLDLGGLEEHQLKARVSKSALMFGKILGAGGTGLEGASLEGARSEGVEGASLVAVKPPDTSAEAAATQEEDADTELGLDRRRMRR